MEGDISLKDAVVERGVKRSRGYSPPLPDVIYEKSCVCCGRTFLPKPVVNAVGVIVENINRDTCVSCLFRYNQI